MTPVLKEQIIDIATYDGWNVIPEGTYNECHNQTIWFGHGGNYDCYIDITAISGMKYLISLDWLHPVAMRVIDELFAIEYVHNDKIALAQTKEIYEGCMCKPNAQGEYDQLFNSVHAAVKIIKKYKIDAQL